MWMYSYKQKPIDKIKQTKYYKSSWKALSLLFLEDDELLAYTSMNRRDNYNIDNGVGCKILDIWLSESLNKEQIEDILSNIFLYIKLWSPCKSHYFNYCWFENSLDISKYLRQYLKNMKKNQSDIQEDITIYRIN